MGEEREGGGEVIKAGIDGVVNAAVSLCSCWLAGKQQVRLRLQLNEKVWAVSLMRRVLVGTCGSPGSIRALRYARDLAASSAATLVPVHAWVPPGGDVADRRAPNPMLRKIWQDSAEQRLQNSIEAAFGGVPDGVDVWPVIMRGPAGEVLVQLASRPDDLLVVGAGRRGLARTLHGKVARYCVAHAACPVLAIPPSPLASYARRWPRALAFRHHGLNADKAFDGADRNSN